MLRENLIAEVVIREIINYDSNSAYLVKQFEKKRIFEF